MISLDDEEVERLIAFPELVDAMSQALIAAANGDAVCPPRSTLSVPEGWFATMPASLSFNGTRALGAKLITAFPSNAALGLPTHLATVSLFDPSTGTPSASIAANWLTEARTTAVSVVATQALWGSRACKHAILGSGALASAHIRGFSDMGMVHDFRLWARAPQKAAALAGLAASLGISATVCSDANEAVGNADVVTTVTASKDPLFESSAVRDGTHINAVGACVPSHRELPAALLARSLVFVDSRVGALIESGDILLAVSDGAFSADSIAGELGDVLTAQIAGRTSKTQITIFESLGLALEDVAAASIAFNRATKVSR